MGSFYAFTINAKATNRTAYYGVLFNGGIQIFQGSFTFTPTATTNTMVGTDASNINLNLPACASISGGVTLETTNSTVGGTIFISPALSVPVTFTLYAGSPIGSVTVNPGQTQVPFNIPAGQGLDEAAAQAALAEIAPQAKREE